MKHSFPLALWENPGCSYKAEESLVWLVSFCFPSNISTQYEGLLSSPHITQ